MDHLTFDAFFKTATRSTAHLADERGFEPFDYQRRLACGERAGRDHAEWVSSGTDCRSLLVNVPTGCGKTAAVVLAWLWNRLALRRQDWPRRLVYCLPMRVLVEQTRDNAVLWLDALGLLGGSVEFETRNGKKRLQCYTPDFADSEKVAIHVLMGGEDEKEWDLYPEREAIIIGTQDMLLSRALNRGYAANRARWPMHFGLFNTDCLWVFDEVQLMGSGVATTAQLEAFRSLLGSKDGHGCRSIWMSATLRRDWLKTIDFRDRVDSLPPVEFGEKDLDSKDAGDRWRALKPLQRASATMGDARSLVLQILNTHKAGTRTIVVVNTVRRACEVFDALRSPADTRKTKGKGKRQHTDLQQGATTDPVGEPALVLLHSRFRPNDRARNFERSLAEPGPAGTIVVSTQVIEAGVDVTATTLFTELAPWPSLVQRFGRCNRRGEANDQAAARWIDIPAKDKDGARISAPYELGELEESAARLRSLTDVGLASLPEIEIPFNHAHVIRRRDLVDLFDTTPDLAGNDIDIDRFVRDIKETDLRVFWRDWSQSHANEPPAEDGPLPTREELCPVPIGEFREFAKDEKRRGKVWRWDFLDGQWERLDPNMIAPGQVFLVRAEAGGYTTERGWDPKAVHRVEPLVAPNAETGGPVDATDADSPSRIGAWQTIAEHTDEVRGELDAILDALRGDDRRASALRLAARWHDRGKAHEVFQNAIDDGQDVRRGKGTIPRSERPEAWRGCRIVAKAPGKRTDDAGVIVDPGFWQRYERKHFRHELAAALSVLDPRNGQIPEDLRDLVAYVVAAHHGKIRLSIRSLPGEKKPPDSNWVRQPSMRFARGVWDGDRLPDTDLGGGVMAPAVTLSLEPMELGLCEQGPFTGEPSWGERMIRLRDSLGPFQLAFLETLVRAADIRASQAAEERAATCGSEKEAGNA
jgi:CRISPR-associated endonuclease/helicase Cas3